MSVETAKELLHYKNITFGADLDLVVPSPKDSPSIRRVGAGDGRFEVSLFCIIKTYQLVDTFQYGDTIRAPTITGCSP